MSAGALHAISPRRQLLRLWRTEFDVTFRCRRRVIDHFQANRLDGESFRDYVLRYKIETFRELTADLAKPAELFPELYQDWGDTEAYSLKLGRGECAV